MKGFFYFRILRFYLYETVVFMHTIAFGICESTEPQILVPR